MIICHFIVLSWTCPQLTAVILAVDVAGAKLTYKVWLKPLKNLTPHTSIFFIQHSKILSLNKEPYEQKS